MRRRLVLVGEVPVEDFPDWALTYRPADWRDQVEARPQPDPTFGGQRWVDIVGFRLWRDAQQAWLAEHAPHVNYRDREREQRRRYPVVDRMPSGRRPTR